MLSVKSSQLRILHQSARRLVVRVSIDGLRLLIIVGHVPCMPDVQAASSWWQQVLRDVSSAYNTWPKIMLVDANACLGSLVSDAVGSHQASEENAHGALLHQWLVDHQMFAPQTMYEHHVGEAPTFTHAKGPERRIDYVLVDTCLRHPDLRSFGLDIDLAVQRPDHFAVAVDLPMHIWQRDRSSPSSSCTQSTAPAHSPVVPWAVDVHSHAAVLHTWLQSCQPRRPKFLRKRHLQDSTWHLIQYKAYHWKRCRQIRTTLRLASLRAVFHGWRHCSCPDNVLPDFSSWLARSHLDLAWHMLRFLRLCPQVAHAVRHDDVLYFEAFANHHNDEALPSLWKSLVTYPSQSSSETSQQSSLRWSCDFGHCAAF